ncbi:hypothetical protein J1605_022839 [Eschrichtius robustus]|uniref:Uncharacterized protein n=1 Tax=Eschrichtius robustus TaxID=9764 RepID=A0AB34H4D4_ESCRO|nr:hypothetical protein J1605_022839 [Eschrichtius robustus]
MSLSVKGADSTWCTGQPSFPLSFLGFLSLLGTSQHLEWSASSPGAGASQQSGVVLALSHVPPALKGRGKEGVSCRLRLRLRLRALHTESPQAPGSQRSSGIPGKRLKGEGASLKSEAKDISRANICFEFLGLLTTCSIWQRLLCPGHSAGNCGEQAWS